MAIAPCFLILLLGIAAVLVVVLVFWRRRGPQVAQPVCGQCGYAVEGLPSFTCPECGADLRQVGIKTPSDARTLSPMAKVAIWTVIVPIPAFVTTAIAGSDAYRTIEVASVEESTGDRPPHAVALQMVLLTKDGRSTRLTVDLPDLDYHYTDPKGKTSAEGTDLDADAIRAWLESVGIDAEDDKVRLEADELASIAQAAVNGIQISNFLTRQFGSGGGSASNRYGPHPAVLIAGLVLWLAVWAGGLYRILRARPAAPAAP